MKQRIKDSLVEAAVKMHNINKDTEFTGFIIGALSEALYQLDKTGNTDKAAEILMLISNAIATDIKDNNTIQ